MIRLKLTLEFGNYSENIGDERAGKRFYSCDSNTESSGSGSPCDTREEVIYFFRRAITTDSYGDKQEIKDSEIELINNTDLKITLGEIRGSDLKKWF